MKHFYFRRVNNRFLYKPAILIVSTFILLLFIANLDLHSQTVVRMMAVQPTELKPNIQSQQYFSEEATFRLGNSRIIEGGTGPFTINWTKNGTIVSSDTAFIVTPKNQDTYTVLITDSRNCTASKNIILVKSNDINTIDDKTITVFPNPSSNYIIVELTNELLEFQGTIYNPTGVIMWQGKISSKTYIPLNYPSGCYLFTLTNQKETFYKKIIVR